MANLRIRIIERIFFHYGTLKSYPANKMIVIKGDVADKIAFIQSGQVRAVVINPDGDEITLFYLGKGDMFGSDSLVPNPVVVVNVETITPCELYVLPAKQFLEIWQAHNYPIQELLAHYLKRISLLSDYICCSHFQMRSNESLISYIPPLKFMGAQSLLQMSRSLLLQA